MIRHDKILFLMIVITCVLCGSFYFLEAPQGIAGYPHPSIKSMLQGQPPPSGSPIILLGWLLGTLTIGIEVQFMKMGVKASKKALTAINLGGLLQILCWTMLVGSYYIETSQLNNGLWGMPISSQLLLLGMWPLPVVFIILYVRKFDQWIFTKEDEKVFQALLEKRDQKGLDNG